MAKRKSITILLIEDSPSDTRLIKESLLDAPHDSFRVTTASTLAKGLRKLKRDSIDAILLDLALPDSDGIETFHAVKKLKPSLPVIVLTMTEDDMLGLKIVHEGAQDYLPKTVLTQEASTTALTRAIRYAIERTHIRAALRHAREQTETLNEGLRVANEELEGRVHARTEELDVANEELQVINEELRHEIEQRTNAERAAQDHAQQQGILSRVISVGNEASDLQTLARTVVDQIIGLVNFDAGTLCLLNKAERVTELKYAAGFSSDYLAARSRLSIDEPHLIRVYRDRQPVLPDDATMPYSVPGTEGIHAAAAFPIVAHNEVIGHIGISRTSTHSFTQEEIALLISIGQEIGTVIARLQTQEALTQEFAITETITRLTPPLLSPSLDFDGLVLAILDDAKRLTASTHGFIALIDPVTKDLVSHGHTQMLLDQCAIPSEQRQIRFPLGADGKYHALSTYAINERQGFFTNAPAEHPAAIGTPDGHVPLERFLAVPALVRDEVVGEIALANAARDYTTHDVAVTGRLAEELLSLAVQRLRAEEQLRASSLYARSLIEASLDPLVTISAEGVITDVNKATEEATGYSRGELIGSDFSGYFTEPTNADAGYRTVFADGFVRDYPLTLRHKSGSMIDVLYNATVYRNEAGEVQGVFAAARDITKLKQAEELLVWEHTLDATLAELYAPLISPTTDFNETTLKILEHAKRITESLHGYVGLIDPITKNMVVYSHTMMMRSGECAVTGKDKRLEFPIGADGQYPALWGYALSIKQPFYTNDPAAHQASAGIPKGHIPLERFLNVPVMLGEELVATVAVANASHEYASKDIDAVKRIADMFSLAIVRQRSDAMLKQYSDHLEDLVRDRTSELAKSEEQYRTLVETANSIICTFDTKGTITFINDYGAQFFGYTPDELIGKNLMILVPEIESSGRAMTPYLDDIVAHPDQHTISVNENIMKDGTRVWVNWVNHMLTDETGHHIGHLTMGYDVTELKRTEDALRDAQRLAAIGQTATMIGHDLRNPLQALQFSLELERRYVEAALKAARADPTVEQTVQKAVRLYEDMEQQIRYMDKIVADLQDYARPLALQRELTHIPSLIDDTLSSLAIPDTITARVDVPDSITATIDPHLMQRALSNLIMNAVQAMPQGGGLTVGATADDHAVVITVHDMGEGVADHMKDTLFSPLTTGKAKGTGLGLAVVKRIVEAHNGTITFTSEEGKGTTFTVTLPQTDG